MRTFLLTVFLASLSVATAQLRISDPGSTEDLSGTVYVVGQEPQSVEHEHPFEVVNESDLTLNVGCRRIELDVVPDQGMESTLCWVICPAYVPVGSQTVRVSDFTSMMDPGEVDESFVMHLRTYGYDACSSYRIEWFDADNDNIVFASIDLVFDHSSASCATGVDDLDISSILNLQPNPADDAVRLNLDRLDTPLNIQVFDILGQEVWTSRMAMGQEWLEIPTAAWNSGIYFVTFSAGDRAIHSEKLVVRH
ncbi:MAG: T9SS type A sorting domain-containing protein [Flavobacteriales bacterium]|nr:T9SS type A sorting domain-containing protein [Flavobacteriales bacterium]